MNSLPPDGFEDEMTGPPDGFADTLSKSTWAQVPGKALNEAIGMAMGVPEVLKRTPPGIATRMVLGESPSEIWKDQQAYSRAGVQAIKEMPGQLMKTAFHPIQSFKERPIGTLSDISLIGGLAGGGLNVARKAAGAASRRILPSVTKATAGIPEKAMTRALERPDLLRQAPVPEEMLSKVVGEPMIEAVTQAKRNIGNVVGKAYRKYAGMESPYQEVLDTPIAQKIRIGEEALPKGVQGPRNMVTTKGELTAIQTPQRAYGDIIVNKKMADQAFKKGDPDALNHLYKQYIGGEKPNLNLLKMNDKDKLQILTRLKREIQRETDFNKAPITMKPIDTAKDAALKQMAHDVDAMRTRLPNGRKLSAVDNAWRSVREIYDTIQGDLSDPGKAKDTMMRLLKQDHTWLSSGRMSGKVSAIRKAELISGQKILDPALDELTRQVFKDWGGKGFVSQVLKGASGAGALFGLANPTVLPAAMAGMASSSPRFIRGGIKAASTVSRGIKSTLPLAKKAGITGSTAFLLNSGHKKRR